jgi:hypothetical protein
VDVVADEAPQGIRPCVCVGCRPAVTAGRSGYPQATGTAASAKRGVKVDRRAGGVSGCGAHMSTEGDDGSEQEAEYTARRCKPLGPSRWPRPHATALPLARRSDQLLRPTLPGPNVERGRGGRTVTPTTAEEYRRRDRPRDCGHRRSSGPYHQCCRTHAGRAARRSTGGLQPSPHREPAPWRGFCVPSRACQPACGPSPG